MYFIKSFSLLICIIFIISCKPFSHSQVSSSNDQWPVSTLENEQLDPTDFKTLIEEIEEGTYGNVDQILVIKNGKAVLNKKFNNDYYKVSKGAISALGCGIDMCKDSSDLHEFNYLHPDWHPYYQNREVHTLQSVTKSIAATMVGIAVLQGHIKDLNEPLASFFEDYKVDHNKAPHFQKITLKHLLRMQSGIEWHEHDRPLDETNTTFQLEISSDWIQFTLDQPMDAEPGTKWVYNSGGSHLMSGIIKKATGKYIDEYAEEFLFKPLGIKTYHWKKTPKGYPDTEGGLFLRAEDLAKIGQLYLNGGIWEGKQLLPKDWVAEATAIQVENVFPNGWGYGYQWWRCDYKNTPVWTGLGFGDQMLCVLPEFQIIGVVNSWNVFGAQNKNIMGDFIKALVNSNL